MVVTNRYAVPQEIQEIDKRTKRECVDDEVLEFQRRYLTPKVVSELPEEIAKSLEEGKLQYESQVQEQPKQKIVGDFSLIFFDFI